MISDAAKSKRMWVCNPCRARKTRCDGKRPSCGSCVVNGKACDYPVHSLEPRPHKRHKRSSEVATEASPPLKSIAPAASKQVLPSPWNTTKPTKLEYPSSSLHLHQSSNPGPSTKVEENDADVDLSDYVTVDDSGNVIVTGHTRTLYAFPKTLNDQSQSVTESQNNPSSSKAFTPKGTQMHRQDIPDYYISAELTANAAKSRQQESVDRNKLLALGTIDGIPSELVLHLIDMYWSRHHFLHLVYRPAFMRELVPGLLEEPGFTPRYYSKLLFYTILAISSRYSDRSSVREDQWAGSVFFDRAKDLLVKDLGTCDLPTACALLLLGNALVGLGQLDLAWLYTGMGIRILVHIGLHVDVSNAAHLGSCTPEHVEICRRAFWGAFLCEKLQSLYLGRPITMHERDVQVPKIFLDNYEEFDIWTPVPDTLPNSESRDEQSYLGRPSYSVSNFKALSGLAELVGQIISNFYAVKSTREPVHQLLVARELIHRDLGKWEEDLPHHLLFEPWRDPQAQVPPIHVVIMHTLHYSLIVLLERPFVADGHLRAVGQRIASESWKRCSVAAFRIAKLLEAYDSAFPLERAPYQFCYSAYVAATILVRNASAATTATKPTTMTTSENENLSEADNDDATLQHPGANTRHSSSQIQERRRMMSALQICLSTFRKMRSWVFGADRLEKLIRGLMARMQVSENDLDEHGIKNENADVEASSNLPPCNKQKVTEGTEPATSIQNGAVNPSPFLANTPDLRVDLETIFRSFNTPDPLSQANTRPKPNPTSTDFPGTDPLLQITTSSSETEPSIPNSTNQREFQNRDVDPVPATSQASVSNFSSTSHVDNANSLPSITIPQSSSFMPFSNEPTISASETPSADLPSDAFDANSIMGEMDQLYGFLIPNDENPLL